MYWPYGNREPKNPNNNIIIIMLLYLHTEALLIVKNPNIRTKSEFLAALYTPCLVIGHYIIYIYINNLGKKKLNNFTGAAISGQKK